MNQRDNTTSSGREQFDGCSLNTVVVRPKMKNQSTFRHKGILNDLVCVNRDCARKQSVEMSQVR